MIAWSCVDGNEPIEWAVLMMQEREGGPATGAMS